MIVLDTNVVSELMRSSGAPAVLAWVDRQADVTLYLSVITVAEIRFGIALLPSGRRRRVLQAGFEDGILPVFGGRILPFDEPASAAYADIRAAARRRGGGIGQADGMIAAIAQVRRFAVATRDVAPFEAAGLRVINPFA